MARTVTVDDLVARRTPHARATVVVLSSKLTEQLADAYAYRRGVLVGADELDQLADAVDVALPRFLSVLAETVEP